MSDDLVKQSLAELHDIVRCRCHPAYTGRGMHDPDCECDSIEAVKAVADRIEKLEAKLAQQDDLVQAAVAAALREADEAIQSVATNCMTEDGHVAILAAVEKVRSLIPEGAQAALDRVVAAERERSFWLGRSCGGSKAEIDAALAAIREGGE